MKSILTSLILAATVIGANANEGAHKVEIKSIVTEIQQTPQFQVNGPKDKKFNPRYWLEIEAELEVMTADKTGKINPDGFIPEIAASWSVIIKDKGTDKTTMLTGKVSFIEVRTKDKKAYLSAYISPDTLEKLLGKDRFGDNDIEAVALVISGPGIVSDGKHAAGLQKATAAEESKWWTTGKYTTMEGVVLAKSKTPFAPLWTDHYPVEKTE